MRMLAANIERWSSDYLPPAGRTGELFLENLRRIQARTDRLFYYLLLIQYPAAIAVALLWSPLAWAGSRSIVHFHVWLAILFGGLLTSLPVYLIRVCPAASLTRQVIAVAQMLMGALLIHLSGGRIETHFHVFGSLAFLAFYKDLRVLATATVIVAGDHLLRGLLVPESVYGVISAGKWRFVEHAFWVVFENIFLGIACVQGRAQLAEMASHQAQLEKVNETIEAAVSIRTRELSLKTKELAAARDAAMEATRLKSQFLATVSHEIRTPMNGVLGMTSLLLETKLNPDQRECASTVQRSAEALLTIINDILDFSKIEAGKLALERVDFPVCEEIENVTRLLAASAQRKGLKLICEIDSGVPAMAAGDPGRLRQILVNLIGNAIKFTEQGQVRVRACEVERRRETSRVRFEVSDTGIGIPEHARTRLFESFVQVDGSTSRKHEGTGLGLAISRQLVELMGGQIGFHSQSGAGSTFWFEIPLEVISKNRANGTELHRLSGLRLLMVGGDAQDRAVIMRAAEAGGMSAEHAADAQHALRTLEHAQAQDQPFHIVILEQKEGDAPGGDTTQLAQAIRRQHLHSTPIVVLQPSGYRAVCHPLQHDGIAGRIMKPVAAEHLASLLASVCGRFEAGLPARTETRPAENSPASASALSVLVAEDNLVNQRVLTRMLEKLGHRYHVVADGAAAIQAAKESAYDLVLMDCQMPRVDGFEATAEIRKLPGRAGRIPIIAVTANAMTGDRERCLAAGMTGYMTKPVRLAELDEALCSAASEAVMIA